MGFEHNCLGIVRVKYCIEFLAIWFVQDLVFWRRAHDYLHVLQTVRRHLHATLLWREIVRQMLHQFN